MEQSSDPGATIKQSTKEAAKKNDGEPQKTSRPNTSDQADRRSASSFEMKPKKSASTKLNEKPVYRGSGRRAARERERMRREIEKQEEKKKRLHAEKEERRKKYREEHARKLAESVNARKSSVKKPIFTISLDRRSTETKTHKGSSNEESKKSQKKMVDKSSYVKLESIRHPVLPKKPSAVKAGSARKFREQRSTSSATLVNTGRVHSAYDQQEAREPQNQVKSFIAELPTAVAVTAAHIMHEAAQNSVRPVEVDLSSSVQRETEETTYFSVTETDVAGEQNELAILASQEFGLNDQTEALRVIERKVHHEESADVEEQIPYEAFVETLLELAGSDDKDAAESPYTELPLKDSGEHIMTIEGSSQVDTVATTAIVIEVAEQLRVVPKDQKNDSIALVAKVSEAATEVRHATRDDSESDVEIKETQARLEIACVALFDHLGIEHDELKTQEFIATLLRSEFAEHEKVLQERKREERKHGLKQSLQYFLGMLGHLLPESSTLQSHVGRFAIFLTHPRALAPLVEAAA